MFQRSKIKKTPLTINSSQTHLPSIQLSSRSNNGSTLNKQLFSINKSSLIKTESKSQTRKRIKTEVTFNAPSKISLGNTVGLGQSTAKKLQEHLKCVLELVKKIQRLREENGIISLEDDVGDGDINSTAFSQIPYDPCLHEMNESICQIKGQIEKQCDQIFKISSRYPKIKKMLQSLLEQKTRQFLVENGRNGKIAAMKAQHRLIKSSQQKLKIYKFIDS